MHLDWDYGNIDHIALHDVLPDETEEVVENDAMDVGVRLRDGKRARSTWEKPTLGASSWSSSPNVLKGTASSRRDQPREKNERSIQAIRREPMRKTLQIPEFKSEAEEAAWWDSHQDEMLATFKQAAQDGTLGRGTLARGSQTAATSIRLDVADIELAKWLAEKRGLRYQTYLKMIIHQQLLKEARGLP
jgi:predicted DNA binding CopG/RHH family protein